MQFTHDLDTLKQTFASQTTQLSHLKDVLRELEPRLTLPLDPSVLHAIDDALETLPTSKPETALPLAGRRG